MNDVHTPARSRSALSRLPWRRLLIVAAVVLAVWLLAYIAAINLMLRGGSLERLINGGTDDVQVKLVGGWSVWPGRVHLDRMQLRFEDRKLQFSVAVDNAVVDIGVLALPSKTVHIEHVRGENVSYLFRHKVTDPKGLEKRLAAYPKIEGFTDPPVITKPKSPPLRDAEYDLWTVQVDHADVSLRELWFQEYRFIGHGRATGGFRLKPKREAQTDPCRLELEGTLSAGPHVIANNFRGSLEAQLDRHDPRAVSGVQIFEKISLALDLRADVPNLQVTELYTGDDLDIRRGAGQLRIATDFEHGRWIEGSKVRFTTDAVSVRKTKTTVSGAAELEALITKGGEDSRVQLTADVPRASLSVRGVPAVRGGPSFQRVRATLGATANIAKPLRVTAISADARAVLQDLRWLNDLLDAPDLLRRGAAEANAKFEWSEGELGTGSFGIEAERVGFVLLDQMLLVSGKLAATGTYDANTKRGQAKKVEVDLPDVGVGKEMLPGGLHARSERLQWQGLPPASFDGRFELTSRTLEPFVPLVISSSIMRALADVVVRLGETRAVFDVKRTPAAWDVMLLQAKSGDVEAFGQMRSERDLRDPCGRWYVQDGLLRVGIEHAGGTASVAPLVSPSWWRETPAASRCALPGKTRKPVR